MLICLNFLMFGNSFPQLSQSLKMTDPNARVVIWRKRFLRLLNFSKIILPFSWHKRNIFSEKADKSRRSVVESRGADSLSSNPRTHPIKSTLWSAMENDCIIHNKSREMVEWTDGETEFRGNWRSGNMKSKCLTSLCFNAVMINAFLQVFWIL